MWTVRASPGCARLPRVSSNVDQIATPGAASAMWLPRFEKFATESLIVVAPTAITGNCGRERSWAAELSLVPHGGDNRGPVGDEGLEQQLLLMRGLAAPADTQVHHVDPLLHAIGEPPQVHDRIHEVHEAPRERVEIRNVVEDLPDVKLAPADAVDPDLVAHDGADRPRHMRPVTNDVTLARCIWDIGVLVRVASYAPCKVRVLLIDARIEDSDPDGVGLPVSRRRAGLGPPDLGEVPHGRRRAAGTAAMVAPPLRTGAAGALRLVRR